MEGRRGRSIKKRNRKTCSEENIISSFTPSAKLVHLKRSSGESNLRGRMPTKRRNAPAKALMLAGNQHIMQRIGSSGTITEGPHALPLLEGLCRLPRVVDSIIEDAFSQWSAARLIVRNVELIWKERKLRLQQICNNVKRGPDSRTGPPASKRRRRDNSKKHTKQQEFEELQQECRVWKKECKLQDAVEGVSKATL